MSEENVVQIPTRTAEQVAAFMTAFVEMTGDTTVKMNLQLYIDQLHKATRPVSGSTWERVATTEWRSEIKYLVLRDGKPLIVE